MKNWILNTLLLAALMLPADARADEWATTMTGRAGLGYTAQKWFYSGLGNELQADKIKEYWDQGYRITSAAHNGNGWMVVMSMGSPYTMQTYYYAAEWPEEWLKQRRNEGYVMTDVTQGPGKWLIVMSQSNTPRQDYWATVSAKTLQDAWKNGYSIDNACSLATGWLVHFVNNPVPQLVRWTDSSQPYENIIDEMYSNGYVIDIMEVNAADEIMLVFTKREGTPNYRWGVDMLGGGFEQEVQNIYDLGGYIAHVGGGLVVDSQPAPLAQQADSPAAPARNNPPARAVRTDDNPPYTFEFKQYQEWVDGAWKIRYAPAKLVIDYETITIEYGKQTWTAQWNDISSDDELTKELFHDLRLGLGEKVSLVFKNIEFRAVDENGYVFLKMNLMSCKDEADLDPMRRLFTKVIKEY